MPGAGHRPGRLQVLAQGAVTYHPAYQFRLGAEHLGGQPPLRHGLGGRYQVIEVSAGKAQAVAVARAPLQLQGDGRLYAQCARVVGEQTRNIRTVVAAEWRPPSLGIGTGVHGRSIGEYHLEAQGVGAGGSVAAGAECHGALSHGAPDRRGAPGHRSPEHGAHPMRL